MSPMMSPRHGNAHDEERGTLTKYNDAQKEARTAYYGRGREVRMEEDRIQ